VYAAILLATEGPMSNWWLEWLGWYLVLKVVLGVAAGIAIGRMLAYVAFRSRSRSLRVAERGESLLALAALVAAYGVGEIVGGYGFLSVFACAMTFRSAERSHDYHAAMHEVAERLERLLTLFVLLVLGIALSRGLLGALDWWGIGIGLTLLLGVRPAAGVLALLPRTKDDVTRAELFTMAFFGVRGIGSLYYLAYAAGHVPEFGSDWLWSTVAFTIVGSVLVHGVLATPVLDRWGRPHDPSEARAS
jgi:NhaP-type Na+/H+ or K+/H+ antiporter